MTKVLVGDIGGTHPRLALVENNKIINIKEISNEEPTITKPINVFLSELNENIENCCISVAGPVHENACEKPTNGVTKVVGKDISEQTKIKNVLVINDFEAIGYAVANIDIQKEKNNLIIPIRDIQPDSNGNRAIIGPGTGIGVSLLLKKENEFEVVASEGGHASAPTLDYEEVISFIKEDLGAKQVDMESVASGQGIPKIFKFPQEKMNVILDKNSKLKEKVDAINETVSDEEILKSNNLSISISQNKLKNKKAFFTMNIFAEILGACAANIALSFNSTGGLFIAGGIAPKNKDILLQGAFMDGFEAHCKSGVKEFLDLIPIYIIDDYDISFLGCNIAAKKKFSL